MDITHNLKKITTAALVCVSRSVVHVFERS
jgi:hypothetical protein